MKSKKTIAILVAVSMVFVLAVTAALTINYIRQKNKTDSNIIAALKAVSDNIMGYTGNGNELASGLIVFDLSEFNVDGIDEYASWAQERYTSETTMLYVKTKTSMQNIDLYDAEEMSRIIGREIDDEIQNKWKIYQFNLEGYAGLFNQEIKIEAGMFFAAYKEGYGTRYTVIQSGKEWTIKNTETTWIS